MFTEIRLQNFKKFSNSKFKLKPKKLSLLAGGNNSGKSTLLQSLAVWDFCIAVIENERGSEALLPAYSGQGIGLSDDEFSPILVPAMNHLWVIPPKISGVQK
ncbi:MAG: AAA family ATPase [Yoonia sp.]|nr:AAA family ATPase [Yoonia sp.]